MQMPRSLSDTTHLFIAGDSRALNFIPDKSVNLIVTSPPYPMVSMWDTLFLGQLTAIETLFKNCQPSDIWEQMHTMLDLVWAECDRVLMDGGFLCINIGDAVRTINGNFMLYPNHSRIIGFFHSRGYSVLPDIHWRKPTNAPNKFMGSGMYPAGAYVTYEHEYILIFRKGHKRIFASDEVQRRRESAFFWEERNMWFSDLWELPGISQKNVSTEGRQKSAAFPIEIPYRLVNMYSIKGDTVLDPFCGCATTTMACMASQRNSVCVDINDSLIDLALRKASLSEPALNCLIDQRIDRHEAFIRSLTEEKKAALYINKPHGTMVKTKQEQELALYKISEVNPHGNTVRCTYSPPQHFASR